jgi:phosphoribosylformylglycinamidine cyclo-ligase
MNTVEEGDAIIGLASSGVHSNGFSLVRKVFDVEHTDLSRYADRLGKPLGETLLTPTRIYVKPVLKLLEEVKVKSISHITGGGFYENIPRALPQGYQAVIDQNAVEVLPIFRLIQEVGNIPERDMFNTFNMGIGMCVVVAKNEAQKAVEILCGCGEKAKIIGEIQKGEHTVCFR